MSRAPGTYGQDELAYAAHPDLVMGNKAAVMHRPKSDIPWRAIWFAQTNDTDSPRTVVLRRGGKSLYRVDCRMTDGPREGTAARARTGHVAAIPVQLHGRDRFNFDFRVLGARCTGSGWRNRMRFDPAVVVTMQI